jgi:hypothetical protein
MKIIEKLANEWWLKNRNETFDQESAYEAGFRKAREMTEELMFKHMHNKNLTWQECMDLIWCGIRKLGEEEA